MHLGIKPLSPEDVAKAKTRTFPEPVIRAFNNLITEKWNGSQSRIYQNEAVEKILEYMLEEHRGNTAKPTRNMLFKNNYLDVEDTYRALGWKVHFDKPGYCEDYEAYFVFSKE